MSGSGVGHVRQISLERTRDKAERSDMSGYCFCIPIFGSDKSDRDLVSEELELGQTCPTRGADKSG
jgi:hypothetical protein